jgi:hypothetical protein
MRTWSLPDWTKSKRVADFSIARFAGSGRIGIGQARVTEAAETKTIQFGMNSGLTDHGSAASS